MKNVLYKTIKVVHALLWFPLSPIIGPDFPQRFLFRGRRKKPTRSGKRLLERERPLPRQWTY